MKECPRCNDTKPLSEFYKNRNTRDGLCVYCKACDKKRVQQNKESINAQRRKRREDHPEIWRGRSLMVLYDITLEDYDVMLESQGNGCAICSKTPEENGRRLCVDHDHETGEVRGLLCDSCNTAIGKFQDSAELCRQAMFYLRWRKQ